MKKLSLLGQSMFELMVAVLVTSITLVGIISLVSTSISNNTFSTDRTSATRYTNEAIEWARGLRDDHWIRFSSLGTPSGRIYCLSQLAADATGLTVGSCSPSQTIPGTPYIREMTVIYDAPSDPAVVEVVVATSWNDPEGYHESRSSTFLSNWRTE